MWHRFKRILKHRWLIEGRTQRTIPSDLRQRLQQRVAESEQRHTGEIRICIEAGLPFSDLWQEASTRHITRQRALTLFSKLRVWDTAHNNGVLIYLLLAERAIELVADRGLSEQVDPQAWTAMVSRMSAAFKNGLFEEGLTEALEDVSALLVQYFPHETGEKNPNELPDAPIVT